MKPEVKAKQITYNKRTDASTFVEDIEIELTITVGETEYSDSVTISSVNIDNATGYECEIDGKRVVLFGFEPS